MWVALVCLGMAAGCRPSAPAYSPLFQQIFLNDSTTFRGVNLGEDIQVAYTLAAPHKPVHEDLYGLSYRYKLEPEGELIVDFFTDNLIEGTDDNRIISIVAQINLADEVETARLYQELREFFNARYNLASGTYGEYVWSNATRDFGVMEVHLKLDGGKRGIIINFVNTQAGIREAG